MPESSLTTKTFVSMNYLSKVHVGFKCYCYFQQWMNDFECSSDLKMCGGCGKRFERRAALQSHLQLCLKRSDAIKEDNVKPPHGEDKQSERDAASLKSSPKSLGSERRKPPIILRRCHPVATIRRSSNDVVIFYGVSFERYGKMYLFVLG